MKLLSFNINSIRARIHQLQAIIDKYQPDVIGLQETKVHDDQFPLNDLSQLGYHLYYHGQKAHYGVALLSKHPALSIRKGLPTDSLDAQTRLIMIDFPTDNGILTIINGYFPQGECNTHPVKFPLKNQFYKDLINYLKTYNTQKQLIAIMGDFNICPLDIDIGISAESKKRWLREGKCSFLPEERQWLDHLFKIGFCDTYRQLYPNVLGQYSWFDYRSKGFKTNTGLRIDLILASQALATYCCDAGIDYPIRAMEKPSDHAPIWTTFTI